MIEAGGVFDPGGDLDQLPPMVTVRALPTSPPQVRIEHLDRDIPAQQLIEALVNFGGAAPADQLPQTVATVKDHCLGHVGRRRPLDHAGRRLR